MNLKTLAASRVALATVTMLAVSTIAIPAAAFAAMTTTPSNLNGWYFYNDQNDSVLTDSADHGFVTGPGTPPIGTGSVHLTKTTNDSYGIATAQFAGTALSAITSLSYSTYRASGTSAQAPSLGFDVDTDNTAADTVYEGRLTYEPYFTQTVSTGSWQTWDTMTGANWWFSHANTGAASQVVTTCTQASPCTWAQVLTAFPHAALRSPGQLILRTNGATGEAFDGNVDNLTIGISGTDTTFDFDPTPTPTVSVTTGAASNISASDATLNATNGAVAATGHSFWVSTSTINTSSPTIPAGVYSTPDMYSVAANTDFDATLSSLTTDAVTGNGVTGVNLPAITPNTTYYYVAWVEVGGTWYPGNMQTVTTSAAPDTTRPTLVYNTPATAGSFATSTLPVSITVSDAGSGIATVIVHLYDSTNHLLGSCGSGNTSVGGAPTYTYTCTVNTAALADGSYSLRSGTTDVAGNNQTVSRTFVVDNTRPNATITAPANSSTQTGDFTITGTATDNLAGIDHVNIFVTKLTSTGGFGGYVVNNQPATWNAGSGTFSYDAHGLADGTYTIKADAFDAAGNNHFASPSPTVTVDNTVPVPASLAITAPANDGDTASGTYDFTAAYDNGVTTNLSWAVRSGTSCVYNGSNAVAGNVNGFHDASTLTGGVFSASLDTTGWTDGQYCFVVNDNHGLKQNRLFSVDNAALITPSAITGAATDLAASSATVHGTNGAVDADTTSFWWGTTAEGPFAAAADPSSEFPAGWSHDTGLGGVSANNVFSESLTGLTASTTYYYAAWSHASGVWYPGSVETFTTLDAGGSGGTIGGTVAQTVTVTPDDLEGWVSSVASGATTGFADDANAPLGTGALELTTTDDVNSVTHFTHDLDVPLAQLAALSFETKQLAAAATSTGNASLRIDINLDGTATSTDDQLMYEPYYNGFDGTTMTGWQTWSISTTSGKFWSNNNNSYNGLGGVSAGSYASNFTIADVLNDHPNAKIVGVVLSMGTYNVSQDVLADNLSIGTTDGTNATTTVYDFEPAAAQPTVFSSFGGGGGSFLTTNTDTSTDTGGTPTDGGTSSTTPSGNGGGQVLGASTYNFTKDLWYHMKNNDDVAALQTFLVGEGYSIPDAVTRFFGPETLAAVKSFQKANGLPVTGFVGKLTRAVLNKGVIPTTPEGN